MKPDTETSPTGCPSCPLGEIRRGMAYCRHYKMSCMIDHDERPEYCRVEKVIIEEDLESQ